jgi:hypothetical protein
MILQSENDQTAGNPHVFHCWDPDPEEIKPSIF